MNHPAGPPNWEQLYQEKAVEQMPWYYPSLEPDILTALQDYKVESGHILDLGTGPGTMAIQLAKLGFQVAAVDISATAVELARAKGEKAGVNVDFRQDNVVETQLETTFDFIFDRGCFHAIAADKRSAYVKNVFDLLKPGGILIMKCFSHKEQGPGPSRFTPEQISSYFQDYFAILSIQETEFLALVDSHPKALLCVMKKAAF